MLTNSKYPSRSAANVTTLRHAFLIGTNRLAEIVLQAEHVGFALPQWNSFVVDLDATDITTYAAFHAMLDTFRGILGDDYVELEVPTPTNAYRDILLNLGGYLDEQGKEVHLFRARMHVSRERLGEEFATEEVTAKRVDGTDYTYNRKVFVDTPYLDTPRPSEF